MPGCARNVAASGRDLGSGVDNWGMSQVKNREQASGRPAAHNHVERDRTTKDGDVFLVRAREASSIFLRIVRACSDFKRERFVLLRLTLKLLLQLIGLSKDRIDNLLSFSFRGFIGWRC